MYLDKENINLIKTIKEASFEDLDKLSTEIREFLVEKVSKTGGHLASNLGAVELTIALHKVFDSPTDKIIFDVGHQSYVHKIITGRAKDFDSLRQMGGISGFPKRSESKHDMFDSGHSSTSISAAYGYAVARDLNNEKYNCIAVIGDGALTGGVAYEALNSVGDSKTPMIIVLNDNQMSISKSTGGMNRYLHKLRTSLGYQKFKSSVKKHTASIPGLYKSLQEFRDFVKNIFIPTGIFEELGIKYFGPIDGHDIKSMVKTLEMAKSLNRPVLVHVITQKGKGYTPAEENPAKFHGIGKFDPKTESTKTEENTLCYSSIFGDELVKIAKEDNRLCAITAAMLEATGLSKMKEEIPSRVFDVGISEQHAVSFAAGLALNKMKPVVCIYSTFLQRAYDQIVSEVALQNLPVIFAIDRAGITGRDGETHQGMFDIAYLNSIPNMTILSPKDGKELREMLRYAVSLNSPVAIRYPRDNDYDLSSLSSNTKPNEAEYLGGKGDNAVIAVGSMVKETIFVNDKINARIYNLKQIKPLQTEFLNSLNAKKIVVVEDGVVNGGIGMTIANYFANTDTKVKAIGLPDKYIEHGSIAELRSKYGLDSESIAKQCEEFFEN